MRFPVALFARPGASAILFGICLAWWSGCRPSPRQLEASVATPTVDPKAGGVMLRRANENARRFASADTPETLRKGDSMLVSFPQPMATQADFDRPVAFPPVAFTPPLPLQFRWKSATEGEVIVQGLPAPGTAYQLGLQPAVHDLAGQVVNAPQWGFIWPAAAFRVWVTNRDFNEDKVPVRPVLGLAFSHPVAASEVVRTAIWRDDRGETIGSEVQLSEPDDPAAATLFHIIPLKPLEVGRHYDLMVEGTKCAIDGSALPYVHAFPLGRTEPLVVEWVRARHQPQLGTFLEIRFSQALDATSVSAATLHVTPPVEIQRTVVNGAEVRAFGAFQTGTRYAIEISAAGIRSRRGFGLALGSAWHATFGAKRAAVILPRSILTTPASRGLDVEFTQVNTGPLHWALARVPAAQVITVRQRLDEYRRLDETNRDPRTAEFRLRPTELLVPGLKLPTVAEGTVDGVDADREVPRKLAFTAAQMEGGVYLLELAGRAKDGRVAGNRALILVNREFLVWKEERTSPHGRLFDLTTGDTVPAASLQVLASDGRLLGTGETDAEGAFAVTEFDHPGRPEVVLVRRGTALSAHFVEFTGSLPWRSPTTDATVPREWLFTDRGIYRPGETIHVKGVLRNETAGKLSLPVTGLPGTWQLTRVGTQEPLLGGEIRLSATGAWEAEVSLPVTTPLGPYELVAFGHSCAVKVDEFRAPAFAVELHPLEAGATAESRVRVLSHYFHGAPNARALVRWRAIWSPYVSDAGELERGRYLSSTDFHSPEKELQPPAWVRRSEEAQNAEAEARSITIDGTAVLEASGAVEVRCPVPFPASARLAAVEARWEISVVAPDGQTVEASGDQRVALARAQPAVGVFPTVRPGEIDLAATAVDMEGNPVAGVALKVTLYRVSEKSVRENISRHVVRYRNTPLYEPVFGREVHAPFREIVAAAGTGRFVAVVELAGSTAPPRASEDVTLTGRTRAEFAQWDDSSLVLQPDRENYLAGDMAHIAVRAPFPGRAWVTVETDRVLASYFVSLTGNAANVDVPVTLAMHPNAFVTVYLFRPQEQGDPAERMGSCEVRLRRPETELQITTKLVAPKVEPGETVRGVVTVTSGGRPAANADVTLFAVDESILRYVQWQLPEPADAFFPFRSHEVATQSGLRQFKSRAADTPLFQKGFLLGDGASGWRSRFVRSRFLALAFWQGSVRADTAGRADFTFAAPDNLTDYRIVAVAHWGTEAFGHGACHVQVARKLQVEPALPRFVRAGDEVELRAILRQGEWALLPVNATCSVDGASLIDAAATEKSLTKDLPQPVVFRAQVKADAARLRVRFAARASNGTDVQDAVELEIPVRPASTLRREAVAGVVPAEGWSPAAVLPSTWHDGQGTVDLVMSSSPWLPLVAGLPTLLEYPHGCVEQVSGRVLAYALMADLLSALPDGAARAPEYQRRVQEGLARLMRAQLPNGDMPYWPGATEAHPFATIQTAWAVVEAQRSGWKTSPSMIARLREALIRMVRRQDRVRISPTLRAFALKVAAELELDAKPVAEALELYQQRDALADDGRAFLALALHRFGILPEEKRELVAELEREPAERAFEPATFGSTARTAALRICARAAIAGGAWTEDERANQRQALTALMSSSQNFSTQENLWMLIAFRALVRVEGTAAINRWELPYPEGARSADGRAAGWYSTSLVDFGAHFSGRANLAGGEGSYLLSATYRLPGNEPRVDRGFRLERIARNLTAPDRDGSATAPFRLGDEVRVTFRVLSERAQAYVALEESLPAAFETVDPEYYRSTLQSQVSTVDEGASLHLSHWEKRDDRTLWYFDEVEPGALSYSVVVRVTSAGRFRWPGAVITPMYDPRFSGLSEGCMIEVR